MASYKIVIDTKGQSKKEKQYQALSAATGNAIDKIDNSDKEKLKETKSATPQVLATTLLVGQIKDTLVNVSEYAISTVGIRTDNQALQNKIDNGMSVASSAISAGTTIASAAALGGPIGAAIGVGIAALQMATTVVKNLDEYNRQIRNDIASNTKSSERLGIIATDKNRKR